MHGSGTLKSGVGYVMPLIFVQNKSQHVYYPLELSLQNFENLKPMSYLFTVVTFFYF